MIVAKIQWSKIDPDLLYRGEKEDYLNIAFKDNKEGRDKYGWDGFITQDVSKEERAAGVKGPIIGNWKHLGERPTRTNQGPDDTQRRRPEPPRGRAPLPQRPAPGQRGRREEPPREPRYGDDAPDADPNF